MSNHCKEFITDEQSKKLKNVIPTAIEDQPKTSIASRVKNSLSNAKGNIKEKVANATDNFKKIITGALPALNSPNSNPAGFFSVVDKAANATLNAFNSIKNTLISNRNKENALLDSLIDCVDADDILSDELAIAQGEILTDIKDDVSILSNNQLRDFNEDPAIQEAVVEKITEKTINQSEARLNRGITNAALYTTQKNSLLKLFDCKVV